jgi:hypothetical protein
VRNTILLEEGFLAAMFRFSKGLIVKPYTWVFYGSLQGKQAGYYKNSRGNYFWAVAGIGINLSIFESDTSL